MGGKGGFAELANWVSPPPDHGSVWGAPPGPAHNPHHASGGFGGGGFSNGAGAFSSAYMGGTYGGGGGNTSGGLGHYGPMNGRFHRGHGGGGGRGGRQRPRSHGLPEVYPRGVDFHEPPPYDVPSERMFQVRYNGPHPPVLPKLMTHSRGQLYVAGTPTARLAVAGYVRRPGTRPLRRPRAQAR